jgi:hypothetical protein
VKELVGSCDVCAHVKNLHHHPHGLFQPLLVLASPWFLLSMDFIMDLPGFNSFDSILMMVDRFTKIAHFIPYNKSITGKKTVRLFFDHVLRYHGLLEDIFLLLWTQSIKVLEMTLLAIKCEGELSSTFHPVID